MISLSKKAAAVKPYYFFNLQKKIDQLKETGRTVLRLDIGSPDLPPPPEVLATLAETVQAPGMHGYTPNRGPAAYREAVARYYWKRFQTTLDPETEVLPLLGSKEGIINLHQVMIDPGDEVLIPNPGYPSYRFGTEHAGGVVREYTLSMANQYLPDAAQIESLLTPRTKVLWLNYPNNPTGATIDIACMQTLVELARKHQFLIIHDAPYTEIYFDGSKPPSILSVPGAKDVAVEINSLSKTFHMAGWRIGMVCGNAEVIQALQVLKSKVDNSTAAPIFAAATKAFTLQRSWMDERNQIMKQRRDCFLPYLKKYAPEYILPHGGFYIWAKIPAQFSTSAVFCDTALQETGVSITPGYIYGSNGVDYYRISLCQPETVLRQAIKQLQDWLK